MTIHPTAIVDPGAELADDVQVGPYAIIEGQVTIGAGCIIGPHAVIHSYTVLGEGCQVGVGTALGGVPQDRKFKGERSFLRIGNNNIFREYVTLHRATGEDQATIIGDDNFFMAYSHIGHNCRVGSHCMLSNCASVGGHSVIEDHVILGGLAAIHQFVTIGRLTIVGGLAGVTRDQPPFVVSEGRPARPRAINVIGLRRHGVASETIDALRKAFRLLYFSGLNIGDGLRRAENEVVQTPEVMQFLEFHHHRNEGSRGRRLQP